MNPIEWLNRNLQPEAMSGNARKVIAFVFLWQEYNYKYNTIKNVKTGGDKIRALKLKDDNTAQQVYLTLKENFITSFSIIRSRVKKNNKPRTKLYINTKNTKFVEYNINGKDSLEDFLLIIYIIRCNFMHGEKLRKENEPIDVELIGWAYDCLDELLREIHYFN